MMSGSARRIERSPVANVVRVEHDLVEPDPAAVARVVAAGTTDCLVGVHFGVDVEALGLDGLHAQGDLALAVRAELAGQSLGDDAIDG